MKCYVLGAVTGGAENAKEIFETYKIALKGKFEILGTPLETAKFQGTYAERFNRAKEFIRQADLIVADMSVASTGAGIEMGMAHLLSKKIVVFAKTESKVSGLVIGLVGEQNIHYYNDSEELLEKITKLFNQDALKSK